MPEQSLQPVDRATVLSVKRLPRAPEGPTLLDLLDRVSLVMDRAFEVPGTRLRFGLNTILMAVPLLGDLIPSLVGAAILAIGLSHYRVPHIVAARMVLNSLLDASLGWVPIVGPLFDLFFKADTRNVRLLMQYAGPNAEQAPATWRHWLFVLGVIGALVLFLALAVLGGFYLVRVLLQTSGS
jgi:hypothetical protein